MLTNLRSQQIFFINLYFGRLFFRICVYRGGLSCDDQTCDGGHWPDKITSSGPNAYNLFCGEFVKASKIFIDIGLCMNEGL